MTQELEQATAVESKAFQEKEQLTSKKNYKKDKISQELYMLIRLSGGSS